MQYRKARRPVPLWTAALGSMQRRPALRGATIAVLLGSLLTGCAMLERSGGGSAPSAAPPGVEQVLAEVDGLIDGGDLEAARDLLREAHTTYPDDLDIAVTLAGVAGDLGDTADSLAAYRDAVTIAARRGDLDSVQLYDEIISEVTGAYPDPVEEKLAAAGGLTEEQSAGPAYGEYSDLMDASAAALDEGDLDAALDAGEQALDIAEQTFGPAHLYTIQALTHLADVRAAAGDVLNAESLLNLAAERAATSLGENHPETVAINDSVASLYADSNRLQDALDLREANAKSLADSLGPDHPMTLAENLERARLLSQLGRFDDAADLLDATCGGYETVLGRYHPQSGDCLAEFAYTMEQAGEDDTARELFGEALEVNTAVHGDAAPEVLFLRAELAELDRRAARYGAAEGELEAILDTVTDAHPDDVDLYTKVAASLARVYEDQGRFAEALQLKQEVYDRRVEAYGEDDPDSLAALSALGDVFLHLGRFDDAVEAYELSLAGYSDLYGNANPSTIVAMNNLGLAYEQSGEYDSAEPLLRAAVNLARGVLGEAHPDTLRYMNNLALLYEAQGNFDRAEPLYRAPIEILSEDLGPDHPETLAITNNLAYLYLLEEDYEQAAKMFDRVYQGFTASVGPDHQNTLKSENNLARAYHALGRLNEAEALFDDALARRRAALGERHVDVQRSMHDLAALYLTEGRLDEAEALLRETLELNESELGPNHPYTFETLDTLAKVLEAEGRSEESIKVRAETFARRTAFLDRMLWATNENAREGYIRLYRPELDAYLRATRKLNSVDGGLALLEVALQRKGLLLDVSAEIQQIAALGLDADLADLAERLTTARKNLAAKTLAGPQDVSGDEHLRQIRELESEVEALEGELARQSALYRETSAKLSVKDLIEAMPENSVLVDWLVVNEEDGTQGLMAGVLTRARGAVHPVLGRVVYDDYAQIRSAITEYREIVQDQGAPDDEILEMGQWAYEQIWQPLEPFIPEGARVFIVPDGALNVVPFEALVDEDEHYLVETTDLVQLSTSRDLIPSSLPPAQGPFMVMAGPDYDTEEVAGPEVLAAARSRAASRAAMRSAADTDPQAVVEQVVAEAQTRGSRGSRAARLRNLSLEAIDSRSAAAKATLRAASEGLRGLRFSPLPGAELEGELIVKEIAADGLANSMFSRREAEEEVLARLDTPPRVLHVATHGFFLKPNDRLRQRLLKMQRSADVALPPPGDNPLLRAGLAFAGINSNAPFLGEIDTENDGVLTALEVLSLNLAGTQLAVLSACETGLGEVHDGEGVYGLRRAFEEAGVKQIVMSLWEVSDAGTQALMTAMYGNLLQGMPPREALRAAQRQLMQDPRWGYPYVWAAFTIVGN